jgi:hypothetical protein
MLINLAGKGSAVKERCHIAWSSQAGDFQERCHSLAATQATWINGSAIIGSGSSVGLLIHTSPG